MFRSLSTRRGPGKYERLGKETAAFVPELKRSNSLPTGSSRNVVINLQRQPKKKAKANNKNKSHPLFSFMDFRRKKRTTARPEFARYLEYVKEGGTWDLNSNKPVIYYN